MWITRSIGGFLPWNYLFYRHREDDLLPTYWEFLQMSLHSFPDPHNTAASSPAEADAAPPTVLMKLCVLVSLLLCVCRRTLTNTALGFIVVNVADVTQALVAALLVLTAGCSTHTRVLTLVHIWKTHKVLSWTDISNRENSANMRWSSAPLFSTVRRKLKPSKWQTPFNRGVNLSVSHNLIWFRFLGSRFNSKWFENSKLFPDSAYKGFNVRIYFRLFYKTEWQIYGMKVEQSVLFFFTY